MTGLPNSWVSTEIANVIATQDDGRSIHQGWSPQCEKSACESENQWGVLKTTAIQEGDFQPEHHKRLPDQLSPRAEIEVHVGDLLITCAGPRVRCGVACLVRSTRPRLMISGKMYRFRAAAGICDPRYLEAFLQSHEARLAIDSMKTGGSDSGLNLTHDRFSNLKLPLAPFQEQARIVAKLEELLSDLNAGVAELKTAQKKLRQYRQSLLKAAVEGALTANWREAQRQQGGPTETGAQLLERILTERRARWEVKQHAKFKEQGKAPPEAWRKKYPEPVRPNTTDLPHLPEGWAWASVEQLAELVSGHTPKDAPEHSKRGEEIPWFKVGDMNQPGNEEWMTSAAAAFSRETAKSLGMKVVPPGTIIFPKRGGAIATNKKRRLRGEGCYDLNTMGLVPVPISSEWLWTWFMGVDLGALADGSNVPQINNPDIAPLCVPLPTTGEQDEIALSLRRHLEAVADQGRAIEHALKQSTAQRQNILRAAFAGQLVPQDPNDEPAGMLLERIRSERAAQAGVKKPRSRAAKELA